MPLSAQLLLLHPSLFSFAIPCSVTAQDSVHHGCPPRNCLLNSQLFLQWKIFAGGNHFQPLLSFARGLKVFLPIYSQNLRIFFFFYQFYLVFRRTGSPGDFQAVPNTSSNREDGLESLESFSLSWPESPSEYGGKWGGNLGEALPGRLTRHFLAALALADFRRLRHRDVVRDWNASFKKKKKKKTGNIFFPPKTKKFEARVDSA